MFEKNIEKFNRLSASRKALLLFVFLLVAAFFIAQGIILRSPRIVGDGVVVEVVRSGEGRALAEGDTAVIDYVAFLEDGREFDRQNSFVFKLNDGTVLRAWSEGVIGMRVGETRRLTVESESAYGERGIPGVVPPNSRVIFEIKLVRIESGITN